MIGRPISARIFLAAAMLFTTSAQGEVFVDSGSCRSVWMFNPTVDLHGHVAGTTDPVKYRWTQTLGPQPVSFDHADALATHARFSAPGVYELKLTATDASGPHSDLLTAEVYDTSRPYPFTFKSTPFNEDFGYTHEQLQRYFTGDLGITYNMEGIDYKRLKAPPPPGVHPRIFINPEDKPDLVRRLTSTEVGRREMTTIRNALANNLMKGPNAAIFNSLAAGDASSLVVKDKVFTALLAYEIFRCYVSDDAAAGAKAVAALATASRVFDDEVLRRNTKNFRDDSSDVTCHQFLALGYDFGFGYMNDQQRAIIRKTLADTTAGQWSIGMDALPALRANTSNWIVNNTLYFLIDDLAIEGEPGRDPAVLPRLRATLERFYVMGVGDDGALYEGMGKGQINAEALIALAKRGKFLIAAGARRHVQDFYLQCMETTGYGWTWDELLGVSNDGSKYADVPSLKYAFPNDPAIDFVYRNDLGKNFSRGEGLNTLNLGFIFQTPDNMMRAIFADDCDTSKTWEQAAADLNGKVPTGAFFNSRGLMVARTGWDAGATRLMFQPRSQPGGHSIPDRNTFMFSALGKIWAPYYSSHVPDDVVASSVILIDGKGPSTIPARVAEYRDDSRMTYAVGDAKFSYSKCEVKGKQGGDVQSFTYNQVRLTKGPEAWADLPWGELPDWYYSNHVPLRWKDYVPVRRAFRTAALVRGNSPYALIADDVQQDQNSHRYTWRMLVSNDVRIATHGEDVVLTDPASDARVLVRSLGEPLAWSRQELNWINAFHRNTVVQALDGTYTGVNANLKVLLYPFREGQPLPNTRSSGQSITVRSTAQTDTLTFKPAAEGRESLKLSATPSAGGN